MTRHQGSRLLTTLAVALVVLSVPSLGGWTGLDYQALTDRQLAILCGEDPSYMKYHLVDCGSLNAPGGQVGGGQCGLPGNEGKSCYACTNTTVSSDLDTSVKFENLFYEAYTLPCGNRSTGTCWNGDCVNTAPEFDENDNRVPCNVVLPINNRQSGPGS